MHVLNIENICWKLVWFKQKTVTAEKINWSVSDIFNPADSPSWLLKEKHGSVLEHVSYLEQSHARLS